jgi:hypothetical protein
MPETKTGLRSGESQSTTRLLLTLWDLDAHKEEVKKGDVTEKIKRTGEKAGDYQGIFENLQKEGAIAFVTKNRSKHVSLAAKGVEMLVDSLKDPNFEFDSQIGARLANALLRLMREMGSLNGVSALAQLSVGIASYDEFKSVALKVYDKLNRDYNLDNLVPIYQIRREIGERVSRSQFNEWLLEMQAKDLVQLIGGEMPGITPEQAEDSIKTKIGGVRYYAKRL